MYVFGLLFVFLKKGKASDLTVVDRSVGLQKETREVVTGPVGILAGHTEQLQSVAIGLCSR